MPTLDYLTNQLSQKESMLAILKLDHARLQDKIDNLTDEITNLKSQIAGTPPEIPSTTPPAIT